ncbi:MAG: hypothetical protein EP329_08640 [Deltaproteobacteria bacterium]|nr:MAG: hypothetical protein EP329_08640 [Deltaproteobacteria bacterium]
MRIWNVKTNREVPKKAASDELRRLGISRPEAALGKLDPGERIAHFLVLADAPPSIQEVMEITGASYAAVYRWTTGRSRFPLDAFLRVIVARNADVRSAVAWAEHWLGVPVDGNGNGDGHD